MKTNIEIGDRFWVFTNWGICNGVVVDIEDGLYRLDIDIDKNNTHKTNDFYYRRNQLFDIFQDAVFTAVRNHAFIYVKEGIR